MEKKKKSLWWFVSLGVAIVGGIVLGYRLFLQVLLRHFLLIPEVDSVGIIGGADGPTAIYVTGGGNPWAAVLVGLGLLILGIIGCVYFRKKR